MAQAQVPGRQAAGLVPTRAAVAAPLVVVAPLAEAQPVVAQGAEVQGAVAV